MHRWPILVSLLVLLLAAPTAAQAAPPDALTALPGSTVDLPFHVETPVEPYTCVELRALELGADVRLAVSTHGDKAVAGTDGDTSRHGLQTFIACSLTRTSLVADVTAAGNTPKARARWSMRTWSSSDGPALFALFGFSQALAQYGDNRAAGRTAGLLAQAARLLDATGHRETATLAWIFATSRAQRALDQALAAEAFEAALAHVRALGWLRYRVVLLNNRALFRAPADPREGQRLVDESYALQAALADPQLAAAIENNVCLARYQYGALAQSETCFRRVLERHIRLGNSSAAVGAARNNLSLALHAQGRYKEAEAGFRRAADERSGSSQPYDQIESLCNVAASLYQLGRPAQAIVQLQQAYSIASANTDNVGRAHAAGILASIYQAWGDSDTAWAYADEAERLARRTGRVAALAPLLRVRARIALARGENDIAFQTIEEAWKLAIANELFQAAANIAPVHALVQLERGDSAGAGRFIDEAQEKLAPYSATTDRIALGMVELRQRRESGDWQGAEEQAKRLDGLLAYPGFARSQLMIERHLLEAALPGADATRLRDRYRVLLKELRRDVAVAPDPDLALRLQELVRPAAEAAITRELAACEDDVACAEASLAAARGFFALEPGFASPAGAVDERLSAPLQALSQLQARDDAGAATEQLILQVRREQARARARVPLVADDDCTSCVDADLVFFFGNARSWRWQRGDDGWRVHEIPAWPQIAHSVQALPEPATRAGALRELSPLVMALAPVAAEKLTVRGDPRLLRIPLAAIPAEDDATLLERHAVVVALRARGAGVEASDRIGFVGTDAAESGLAGVPQEKRIVEEWATRHALAYAGDASAQEQPLSLLHLVAHGQRDLGAGVSVLWIDERPLLGYLSAGGPRARTVIINACDSGAASERGPVQASIASAFLHSGARAVVATYFPVPDRAAANFARAFYAEYDPRRDNLADAVRKAQLELRKRRYVDPSWAAYYVAVADETTH